MVAARAPPLNGGVVAASRLPIYARWTMLALGAAPGRSGRALCPVASWLISEAPDLAPREVDPLRLSAIRARTRVVDALLTQVAADAARRGECVDFWTIGGGFDGRWARLAALPGAEHHRFVEVEHPRVLARKHELLARAPHAEMWARVECIPIVAAGWGAERRRDARLVVILEGMLHRLSARGLRSLLRRIADDVPGAHTLLDLTGVYGAARPGWSARRLVEVGHRVVDDVQHAPRDSIFDALGRAHCAGSVPVRVVHAIAGTGSPTR